MHFKSNIDLLAQLDTIIAYRTCTSNKLIYIIATLPTHPTTPADW